MHVKVYAERMIRRFSSAETDKLTGQGVSDAVVILVLD